MSMRNPGISRAARWSWLLFYGISCSLCGHALTGCGKKPAASHAAESDHESEAGNGAAHESSRPSKASTSSKKGKDKVVYIGDIPKDVWFDDPLEIARNTA